MLSSPIISHTFLDLAVENRYISDGRNGHPDMSIMLDTLMALLRENILGKLQSDLDNMLVAAIMGDEMNHTVPPIHTFPLELATTRVHDFGDSMQQPSNGYRRLLRTWAYTGTSIPPLIGFANPVSEIFAILPEHPININNVRTWAPMGMKAESTFVLIFKQLPTSSPIPSRSHSQISLELDPFADGTNIISANTAPSPLSSSHPVDDLLEDIASHSVELPLQAAAEQPYTSRMLPILLYHGTSAKVAAQTLGASPADIDAAVFVATAPLLKMVRNHLAMVKVLEILALFDRAAGVGLDEKAAVTYQGGMNLTSEQVLREFGWSMASFKHKCNWYFWADEVAKNYEWKNTVTQRKLFKYETSTLDCLTYNFAEHILYPTWLGIQSLWDVNGPVETGECENLPSYSISLMQKDITKHKAVLAGDCLQRKSTEMQE